ncbi:MAG TPA: DUF3108 domain-containing protein [Chromatiaceae bacterium]|nr:DUF3108 domain-containing protein [Chromatiaceae bacterium]
MKMPRQIGWFLLLATMLCGHAVADAETLRYEASYKGPFSAGKKIPIAAIQLASQYIQLAERGRVLQTTLRVTSKPYDFVEEHFPFRVRYRSLYSPDRKHMLALEKYQKTSRVKHEINWVDVGQRQLLRFRQKGKSVGQRLFPASLQQWLGPGETFEFHKYSRHGLEDGLLDWLSMLQVVRTRPLEPGKEYHFPVTDGKHLYHYMVKVRKRHHIEVAGRKHLAWKLRFDAVEEGEPGAAHRPLYVWLADDDRRTPLLFENRHPLGRFLVSLSLVQ